MCCDDLTIAVQNAGAIPLQESGRPVHPEGGLGESDVHMTIDVQGQPPGMFERDDDLSDAAACETVPGPLSGRAGQPEPYA